MEWGACYLATLVYHGELPLHLSWRMRAPRACRIDLGRPGVNTADSERCADGVSPQSRLKARWYARGASIRDYPCHEAALE
jgi:hypothetical protein